MRLTAKSPHTNAGRINGMRAMARAGGRATMVDGIHLVIVPVGRCLTI
jgi:hypothetical protein